MRRFELSEGTSSKFWECAVEGNALTVRFGRIGTQGQAQTRTLASPEKAVAEQQKLIREKTAKGYAEVASTMGPAPAAPAPAPAAAPAAAAPIAVAAAAATAPAPAATPAPVPAPAAVRRPASPPAWDAAALYAELGTRMRKELKGQNNYLRKKHDDGWYERFQKAGALFESDQLPARLDAEVEGAYGHFVDTEMVIRYWVAKEGPAFAVRAWFEMWRSDPWGNAIPNPPGTIYTYCREYAGEWFALRRVIAALDEKGYGQAREEAATLRQQAPRTVRGALCLAFPAEAAWAAEEATTWLEQGPIPDVGVRQTGHVLAILTAVADDALRDRFAAALLAKLQTLSYPAPEFMAALLETQGAAALPAAVRLLDRAEGKGKQELAEQIAALAVPAAARLLAERLDDKAVRAPAQALLVAHPEWAIPALAEVVAGRGKASEAALRVLTGLAGGSPAALAAATQKLTGKARSVLDELAARMAPAPEAAAADLPRVLASPPWKSGRKPAPLPSVPGLRAAPLEEELVWQTGERDRYGRALPATEPTIELELLLNWNELPAKVAMRSARMDDHVRQKIEKSSPDDWQRELHFVSSHLHAMSDGAALAAWNERGDHLRSAGEADLDYVLSRFGVQSLPGFLAYATTQPIKAVATLRRVASTRLAPLMADAHHRMKKAGADARRWLAAFPAHAAAGLLPLALDGAAEGRARDAACSALRWMAQNGHAEAVRVAAGQLGPAAATGAEAVLAFDPLDAYPAKLVKLPAWCEVASLPRPRLQGSRRALPVPAVEALVTMLAFSPLDGPYAGLDPVVKACEPRSLAELAWALFQEWLLAGGTGKEDWALLALGHLGDDEVARRLAPLLRAWPGEAAHARAVKGLDVLAAIGSDVALMHLHGIAEKVKFKGLQQKARQKIAEVAEGRGLSPEELADRLVPTLELDADGSRVLSFGARQFRVGFNERLEPVVLDGAGTVLADLPKASKADDAEQAAQALATWKALKKDIKTLAKGQLLRLERAMSEQRRWTGEAFGLFFVEHPLMVHLTRRLLWGVFDGERVTATFRVAEDRSLAGPDDAAFELSAAAQVGLIHPLELEAVLLGGWSRVFGDYELLQPFAQLGREVHRCPPAEARASATSRFEGLKVPIGKVLGLEDRGWQRGMAQDAGWIWDMTRSLPGDRRAELALTDGILAGDLAESAKEQGLGALTLHAVGGETPVTFGELAAVTYSELVRDVEMLRAR